MAEERDEHERADRNRERSEEAHWRAAEAGAEDEERRPEAPRPAEQEDDRETEGDALDREAAHGGENGADDPRQG